MYYHADRFRLWLIQAPSDVRAQSIANILVHDRQVKPFRIKVATAPPNGFGIFRLRRLALAGVGLARMATFTVREDIDAGRLVPVVDHLNPGDRETFHAVFQGQGGALPSRVRVMLDFLAARARLSG